MEPKSLHAWLMAVIQTLVNAGIITDVIKYAKYTLRLQRLQSGVRNYGSASSAAGKKIIDTNIAPIRFYILCSAFHSLKTIFTPIP